MSLPVMVWVLKHSETRLGRRLVLLALAEFAHDDGSRAFPSVETLAERTRLSERQVQRCLQALESSGDIAKTGVTKTGTNIYRINLGGGDILSPVADKMSPDPLVDPSVPYGTAAEDAAPTSNMTPAQQLTAYYVDASRLAGAEPMKRMVGQVAQQVGQLLDHDYKPREISDAIDKMVAQGLGPATLASLAWELKVRRGHKAKHLGYVCHVCELEFKSQARRREHLDVVHGIEEAS